MRAKRVAKYFRNSCMRAKWAKKFCKIVTFPKISSKVKVILFIFFQEEDRLLFLLSIFKVRILSPDPMLVMVRLGSRRSRRGGGGGGSNLPKKNRQAIKKRWKGKRGGGGFSGGFSIYCALIWSKFTFAIETNSFTDNDFYKYYIPWYFLQAKHIRDDCFSFVKCISDVTLGEGVFWGTSPR